MDTLTDTRMQSVSAELDAFLASGFDDSWLVEETLKTSPHEVTELVRRRGDPAEKGERFVRKRIDCVKGLGSAYEELFRAQGDGVELPCVPWIVSCERSGGSLTVVMEFIEGDALDRFALAFGTGAALARLVVPALADAVSCLHEQLASPLIHRDLKPQNVIVRRGAPVIIDFGIARSWREGADTDTAHFLTRAYAPPEQFGFGQTDERSDVYALGKLLFFCLTGETPPSVCDMGSLEAAGIFGDCAQVVSRACAFDPAARFRTAQAFSAAARDALGALSGGGAARRGAFCRARGIGDGRALFIESEPPSAPAAGIGRAHASARVKALRALGAVPHWVGRVWNAFIVLTWALFLLGCVIAVVDPNPHDAALPTWFLILEYLGMGALGFTVVAYLMLDRRRLRRRFTVLARRGVLAETGAGVAIIAASMLATIVAGMASGSI